MWTKLLGLLDGGARRTAERDDSQSSDGTVESFRTMVSRKRKISYGELKRIAQEHSESSFREFVGYPFLIGSAVVEGEVTSRSASPRPAQRRKTMLFRPAELLASLSRASDAVQNIVFPLAAWGDGGTLQLREYTIGSDAENDIVIADFSVSGSHAVIRYRDGRYTLLDLGSTNGTTVNGVRVESPGAELKDGDKVKFSRYEFCFIAPESLYRKLSQ